VELRKSARVKLDFGKRVVHSMRTTGLARSLKRLAWQIFLLPLGLRLQSQRIVGLAMRLAASPVGQTKQIHPRKPLLVVYPKLGGLADFEASIPYLATDTFQPVVILELFWKKIGRAFSYRKPAEILLARQDGLGKELQDFENTALSTFLSGVLFEFQKTWRLAGFLVQNFDYPPMPQLAEAFESCNLPFLIMYKECLKTPNQATQFLEDQKKLYRHFPSAVIAVYGEAEQQLMSKSLGVPKTSIEVVGCPRMDSLHLRRLAQEPLGESIVLFSTDKNAGCYTPLNPSLDNCPDWTASAKTVESWFVDVARKFPEIPFKIKVKLGADSEFLSRLPDGLPDNMEIIFDGLATELVANARAIVAFNSTTIFEGIARGAHVLVPDMLSIYGPRADGWILGIGSLTNQFKTLEELECCIESILDSPTHLPLDLARTAEAVFSHHMGRADGKSGARLARFLEVALQNDGESISV